MRENTPDRVVEHNGVGRLSGARNEAVEAVMERNIAEGKCGFCSPRFEETNGQLRIALDLFDHWNVWHSMSPFPGTQQHLMLASKRHVDDINELTDVAWVELKNVIEWLKQEFGYVSYSFLGRWGDGAFNSATIYHLHAHVIVSDGKPASEKMIRDDYLRIIEAVMELLPTHLRGQHEALDEFRETIDLWRAAQLGKAVPIRAKLSNQVGTNKLP